jgi:hypothetical protein
MLFVLASVSYLPLNLCNNTGKAETLCNRSVLFAVLGDGATCNSAIGRPASWLCMIDNMVLRIYGASVTRRNCA